MAKSTDILEILKQAAGRVPNKGMDDQIVAKLSPGEWVWPSDVVSMLGDGSSEAGGRVLEKALESIRKMKAPKKGKQAKRMAGGGPSVPPPALAEGGPVPRLYRKGGKIPKSVEGVLRTLGVLM